MRAPGFGLKPGIDPLAILAPRDGAAPSPLVAEIEIPHGLRRLTNCSAG
jgi:hypothetical protein